MDYLHNVTLDKGLEFREGVIVYGYRDLTIQLKSISDAEFRQRFGDGSVIIKWIQKNFNDEKLLLRLELVTTRREFIRVLDKRISQLLEEKGKKKHEPVNFKMPFYINVVFFIVFVAVVLSFLKYAYLNDQDSLLKYREKNEALQNTNEIYIDRIVYLEKANLELKKELASKNLIELETGIPSPTDRIKLDNIKANDSVVLVQIGNSYLSEFTDTDSMLPTLDSGAIGIEIIPRNESEIYEGDIISYSISDGSIIIHRVVQIGNDSEGWFAVTKGDSVPFVDKEYVRFSQIRGILVGILY